MGRKKKSNKADARGYSKGPMQPKPKETTPALKQQTHNQMKELLHQFSNSSMQQSVENAAAPSNRFRSRLGNIVSRLDELGFSEPQIEQTVLALQYQITLENALDHLCLNEDTLELPPLFTDGGLREELNTETTSESLVVVSNENRGNVKSDQIEFEDNLLAISTDKITSKSEDNDTDDKQKQKEWLLRQYQYEEEDEYVSDNVEIDDISQNKPLTPEEQELLEKEKELKELQDDVNNDANNYMRSKQEIKALQIQAKKMKQQVDGLKRKVERIRRQQQQEVSKSEEEAGAAVGAENDEEACGGFFDLFGDSQQDEVATPALAVETQQPQQPRKILEYSIPRGWTGTTPEKKLAEICRKQKMLAPKYTKLPRLVFIIICAPYFGLCLTEYAPWT